MDCVAQQVANFITTKLDNLPGSILSGSGVLLNGKNAGILTPLSLQTIFENPYTIGGVTPNTAVFSHLTCNNGANIGGIS